MKRPRRDEEWRPSRDDEWRPRGDDEWRPRDHCDDEEEEWNPRDKKWMMKKNKRQDDEWNTNEWGKGSWTARPDEPVA